MPPKDTLGARLWEWRWPALLVLPFVVLYVASGAWRTWPVLVALPLVGLLGYGLVRVGGYVLRQIADAFTDGPPPRG